MKFRRVLIQMIVALSVLSFSANAQINISSISIKIGSIRTFFSDEYDHYNYALNTELQIGGLFLTKYFNWSVYWSYWNDGLDKALFMDAWTYSFSSHIVGARLSFSPIQIAYKWYIPVDIFTGVAEHFIKARYIGGIDWYGRTGENYSRETTTFELGLSLLINLIGSWNFLAEVQQFFPLGSTDLDQMQRNRRAYKIGLSYSLRNAV